LRLAPEVGSSKFFDDLVRKRTANSLKAIPIFGLLKKKDKGPVERFDEKRLSIPNKPYHPRDVTLTSWYLFIM
jgi:hypothetical protein